MFIVQIEGDRAGSQRLFEQTFVGGWLSQQVQENVTAGATLWHPRVIRERCKKHQ